jgi:Cu2+-exporting ATPase
MIARNQTSDRALHERDGHRPQHNSHEHHQHYHSSYHAGKVRVTRTGDEITINQMKHLVEEALAIAAALETTSEYSLAKAVVEAAQHRRIDTPRTTDFNTVTGRGVEQKINGKIYRIGRPEWSKELKIALPTFVWEGLERADERGESAVVLLEENRAIALITLADRVRERAREAVKQLQEMGVRVVMVTGDAEAVTQSVANELGIDRSLARVLPEEKVNTIRKLKTEDPVAFVGDGINDAAALLEANIGIAIGAGTNVAIESADLVLVDESFDSHCSD